jgi:hypothetical protein
MNKEIELREPKDPEGDAELLLSYEPKLKEGIDYCLEAGLFVLTATFLQKRGYCCESGCRHCPCQNRNAES